MTHISNCTTTEIIPATENIMRIIWMIWPVRNNPQPKIPVKIFGYGWHLFWIGCPLRPYRAITPVMNFFQCSDLSFIDPFFYQRHTGSLTPVSYTHLRAHETPEHLVCRLLLEKKKH